MEHIWTVICANSIVDIDTNNLSLINVVEQFKLPPIIGDSQPMLLGVTLSIVSFWRRSNLEIAEGDQEIGVDIVDPKGNKEENEPMIVSWQQYSRIRNRITLAGLPFNGYGTYWFEVKTKSDGEWKIVARVPVEIVADTIYDTPINA